jgi:hypothetical protein
MYQGNVPQPEPQRSLIQRALGTAAAPLDIGLTLASGLGRAVAAPIYGLVSGRQEAGVEEVMRGTRQPQTPEGQAALEAIAPALRYFPPVQAVQGPLGATRAALRPAADLTRAVGADVRQAAISRESQRVAAKVAQSQELGPKIDAAAAGRDLGLAVPPMQVAPSKTAERVQTLAGSENIIDEANKVNAPKWKAAAREDLGLPAGQKLDKAAFDAALSKPSLTEPYKAVAKLGVLDDPNVNVGVQLENLKPVALAGDTGEAAAAAAWLSKLQDDVANGLDANVATRSIRQFRDEATAMFKAQRSGQLISPENIAIARAKQGAADALERLIEQNIQDKTILYEYQRARAANARIYDYMRATDFASGEIDPKVLAGLASEGRPLSGNLAKMADFAANFPEVSDPLRSSMTPSVLNTVRRGGYGGVIGGITGFAVGGPAGGLLGSLAGSQIANKLRDAAARSAVGPRAQAQVANALDYRLNQLTPELNPAAIDPNRLLPTPYNWANATAPNWTPGRGGPNVTFGAEPPPGVPLLGINTAEQTMADVQAMRAGQYQSDMLRAQAAERAAREAEQSRFGQMANTLGGQRGSREGVPLDYSVGSGRFYPAEGTPTGPVIAPTTLETAVQKMSGPEPQRFNLAADELVAWNKAKADLAIAEPGFNKLSDAQVAAKMADRNWVASTIQAARAKLEALGRQEAAQAEALANRNNLRQMGQEIAARKAEIEKIRAERESLMNSLDVLEERLRAPRPVELGGQGPKTRAAQREANPGRTNMLAPEAPVANQLIMPESVGGGPRPKAGPVEVTAGPSLESRRPPPPPPPPPAPGAQKLVQSMADTFGYAPESAAKFANDVQWLTDKIPELQKMLAFENEMAKAGMKQSGYASKLPGLLDAIKARLVELKAK